MRVTALEIALEYSQHPDSQVRANGCAVLAEIDDPAAVDRLGELAGLTREANPKVRAIALKALARQARHDEGAAGRLAASLGEEDDQSVLRQTLDSLRASDLPPARAAEALGKLLRPEVEERLRQPAVDELGEFGRHDAVALDLLMRAAREDESAAVRAAALRHVRAVVEARPSLVAELLSGDAADRHYSALSRLRREGLSWPVLRRPWLDRLRLARRARAEANNRDATVSPLVIQVPALIAAVAVPPMLWSMLGALADRSVRGASVNAYLLLATIAAVIVALLIPWLARPAGLAADRLAGAAAELLDLAPKTVVSGVALAIAALLFEAVLGSLTTLEAPQLRVLLVAVAGLPFLLFLVRSATLVAYGLVAAPAAGSGVQPHWGRSPGSGVR